MHTPSCEFNHPGGWSMLGEVKLDSVSMDSVKKSDGELVQNARTGLRIRPPDRVVGTG